MRILNFGSCNLDYVYSLDHIVRVGETENTDKMEIFAGGKGLNQSIAIARAGENVFHAGCIGEDGEMLIDLLRDSNVDVSLMKRVDSKNGHAIIQVSCVGENSIFLFPGSNAMVTKEYIDEVLQSFSAGDLVLLQNEISHVDYIVRRACEMGMRIMLNPSPFNDKLKDIDYSMLSYIVLNEVEAAEIAGCEGVDDIIAFFREKYPSLKVMLTLGKRGCVYFDSVSVVKHDIFKVDAVDTTAAGDTFTGYFISGIVRGDDVERVLKMASAASAIAVSRMGAAPSIPMRDEVLAFLKND